MHRARDNALVIKSSCRQPVANIAQADASRRSAVPGDPGFYLERT